MLSNTIFKPKKLNMCIVCLFLLVCIIRRTDVAVMLTNLYIVIDIYEMRKGTVCSQLQSGSVKKICRFVNMTTVCVSQVRDSQVSNKLHIRTKYNGTSQEEFAHGRSCFAFRIPLEF